MFYQYRILCIGHNSAILDILISRDHTGSISTSLYRKPTFSGLHLKWDSFVPFQYKRGLVNCLVHRAWKICSSYDKFHGEMEFIKSVLGSNGYPSNFVESCIQKYLQKKYESKSTETLPEFGPERKSVTLCLPYIGDSSIKL